MNLDAETLEKMKVKCVFVADWTCPIETSEIPIEVCKLCLAARKLQSKQVKITRQVKAVEVLPAQNGVSDADAEIPEIIF
jgi:hypothetical protein